MSRRRPRSKQVKAKDVICPVCGNRAVTVLSTFGTKHFCCGLESYNGKPLVSRNVLRLRVLAHDSFDPLWKGGSMTRSEAYKALAKELQIDRAKCHIGDMDDGLLRNVPFAVERIKFQLKVLRVDDPSLEPKQKAFRP